MDCQRQDLKQQDAVYLCL